MSIDVSSWPPLLQLERVGAHLFERRPEHAGTAEELTRNVVFGGQVLAQMIVASHIDRNADREDDKDVKSIHAIFARAGDYTQPIRYEVDQSMPVERSVATRSPSPRAGGSCRAA